MKKLKTTELNGHPFTLDDLGFIQDAYTEVFSALLDGLRGDNTVTACILIGCDITPNGGNFDISTGFVEVLGEVFYVPFMSNVALPSGLGLAKLYIAEVDVSPSPVIYGDLTAKNVHKRRQMQLVDSASVPGGAFSVSYSSLTKIQKVLAYRLEQEAWRNVGTSGNGTFGTGWAELSSSNNQRLSFRKGISERYEMRGATQHSGYVDGSVVCTLPSEARPTKKRGFVVPYNTGDGSGVMIGSAFITILPNGEVSVKCDVGSSPSLTLYFDGVNYSL